jgi:hypothetical protein
MINVKNQCRVSAVEEDNTMIHQHLHSVYIYYCYNCVSASRTSVTIAVQPVLRGHIWDKEKVVLQYR